jgi:hypothetical protein
MRAKLVSEAMSDILKPKEGALEKLQTWDLKDLIFYGDIGTYPESLDEWLTDNPNLAEALEYKGIEDATNIYGFDMEMMGDEFPGGRELFSNIIRNSEFSVDERISKDRDGGLNLEIGTIYDGSKVIRYQGGLVDGFIARKEWLN